MTPEQKRMLRLEAVAQATKDVTTSSRFVPITLTAASAVTSAPAVGAAAISSDAFGGDRPMGMRGAASRPLI